MRKKFLIHLFFSILLMHSFLLGTAQKFTASVSATFDADQNDKVFKWNGDYVMAEETDNRAQFGYTYRIGKGQYGIRLSRYDSSMHLRKELLDFTREDFLPVGDAMIPLTNSSLLLPLKKMASLERSEKKAYGEPLLLIDIRKYY